MKNRFIDMWADTVINHRFKLLFLLLSVIVVAFFPMKNIYFDNSAEALFVEGDDNIANYDRLRSYFGDSEYLSIAFESTQSNDTVFNKETLAAIHLLTQFLQIHQTVNKVSSLTTYQYLQSKNDTLKTIDLIDNLKQIDQSTLSFEQMHQIMLGESHIQGFLITKDMKHTQIIARTEHIKQEVAHQIKLITDLNVFITDNQLDQNTAFKLHIFGEPLIQERFVNLVQEDQRMLNPMVLLIILSFLFLTFRSWISVWMPMIVILASIFILLGIQGALGWPMNSIITALPIILIIMGIGDSVHMMVEFFRLKRAGLASTLAAREAIVKVFMPCLYTSLTTAAGFVALSVTKIEPVRAFGILGAVGALVVFLFSVTLLPILLSLFSHKRYLRKRQDKIEFASGFVAFFPDFTERFQKTIVLLSLLIALVCVALSSQLSADSNFINFFKPQSIFRQDFAYIDKVFKGANIEFIIDAGSDGGALEPKFLKRLQDFQQRLEAMPYAGKPNSLVNHIRKMNQVLNNDNPKDYRIPQTRIMVSQLLFLYESQGPKEDLSDLRDFDSRYARLSLPVENMTAGQFHQVLEKIREISASEFEDLNTTMTGPLVLFNAQDIYLRNGLIDSFSLSLIMIILCFFIAFGSLKYGTLALIPTLLPIMFAGAIMSLASIPIDVGILLVAAMTIGIAVDDSVHILFRYVESRKVGNNVKSSIATALNESGRAVVYTTLILVCGFSVFMLGNFMNIVYMGVFSAVIMGMALLCNLLLLPATLYMFDSKYPHQPDEQQLKNDLG